MICYSAISNTTKFGPYKLQKPKTVTLALPPDSSRSWKGLQKTACKSWKGLSYHRTVVDLGSHIRIIIHSQVLEAYVQSFKV